MKTSDGSRVCAYAIALYRDLLLEMVLDFGVSYASGSAARGGVGGFRGGMRPPHLA